VADVVRGGPAPTPRELAHIYRRLVGARLRADWQYRTSFFLFLASQFFVTVLDFAAIAVIFSQVSMLDGWSFAEVAFLFGTTGVAFTLADVFVSEVELASRHIKEGSFDQFLIRPLGPLFLLCCQEFALRRAGRLLQTTTVLVIALFAVDVAWDPAKVVMVPVTILGGFAIFGALWVITSAMAFWTVETQEVANSFTYGGNFITQYPLDVVGDLLRTLLVIIPLAFVNYVPACWILDKPDATGLPSWAAFCSPVVAAISVLVARVVWRAAIRQYRSTGT
jgi:ABC-2 type transport system permease protein